MDLVNSLIDALERLLRCYKQWKWMELLFLCSFA